MKKYTFLYLLIFTINILKGQCPDLTITNAGLQSLTANKLVYTLNFTNSGNLIASLKGIKEDDVDNVKISTYLSFDQTISSDDKLLTDILLGQSQLQEIKPGEVFAVTYNDSVSTSNFAFVILHIDSKNVLKECSESNNYYYLPLKISKPTLMVSSIEKPAGSKVEIPVYGSNFQNLLGFQFSINTITSNVFRIDSIGLLGLPEWSKNDLRIKNSTMIGAIWFSNQSEGITFEQKVKLFTIYGTIIGKAGECTDLNLDNSFLSIEVISSNPLAEATIPNLVHGKVCVQKFVECVGRVTFSDSKPIPNVIVLANTVITNTDLNGYYKFKEIIAGENYTISADKRDLYTQGLSIIDILIIKKHILQIQDLPSPYEIIAADVNGDLTVSVQDLILIRSLILGMIPNFGKTPVWQFIPKEYKFKNPKDPFKENYPISYNLEKIIKGNINLDFIGIKAGDVNLDAVNRFTQLEARSKNIVKLEIDNLPITTNTVNTIPMRIKTTDIDGFQLSLSVDSGVSIEKITSNLKGFSSMNYRKSDDQVKIIWYSSDNESIINDAEIVFHISSNKLIVSAQTVFKINDELTSLLQDHSENLYTLNFDYKSKSLNKRIKHDVVVYPNPFTDHVLISVENVPSGEIQWFITNLAGQVILKNSIPISASSGKIIEKINLYNLPDGMYSITCVTANGTYTKKIIKNK